VRQIELPLVDGEARLILEALAELEAKWAHICDTSKDDDEIADYGNDLIALRLLIGKVKEAAVPVFGAGVTNFSRTPFQVQGWDAHRRLGRGVAESQHRYAWRCWDCHPSLWGSG
jgi:hypothetical protein